MPKVLIAPLTLAKIEGEHLQTLRDAGFELIFPKQAHQQTEEELLALLPGVTASVAGMEPYTARVLDACPTLRVIARVGVGYDAVDIPAAVGGPTAYVGFTAATGGLFARQAIDSWTYAEDTPQGPTITDLHVESDSMNGTRLVASAARIARHPRQAFPQTFDWNGLRGFYGLCNGQWATHDPVSRPH